MFTKASLWESKGQPNGHSSNTEGDTFWRTHRKLFRVRSHLIFCTAISLPLSVHLFLQDRASKIPPRDYREKSMPKSSMCFRIPICWDRVAQPFFLCVGASGSWPGQGEAVFTMRSTGVIKDRRTGWKKVSPAIQNREKTGKGPSLGM